ncbi:MAG TPA: hypothetical protein VFE32_14885 [Puia sp.]|jgi:hypothetical protein|nr:hypothetical protein [Puia sp.]
MSQFKDNSRIYDQLICLSEKEKLAPMEVVKDFFAYYRLSELRNIQDQIQQLCLTSEEGAFSQAKSRSNLLAYNYKLIRVLEAASLLNGVLLSSVSTGRNEVPLNKSIPRRIVDTRISDLVKSINEVGIEVAKLYLLIVKAWTAQLYSELKLPTNKNKKARAAPILPPVNLEEIHSMAQALQNKLVNLIGAGTDILINDLHIHIINPQQ